MKNRLLLGLAALLVTVPVVGVAQTAPTPFITRFKGKAPPMIDAVDRTGKHHDLSAQRGKITIVNLWATWCAPCRAELPSLEKLAANRGKDLAVVALSTDLVGWPAIDRFWGKNYPHLRPLLASDSDIMPNLGAIALPYTLVLDRDGKEIARVPRATDWNSPTAQALIDQAIAQR